MNKQIKLYLDTSVIGGYFDEEFANNKNQVIPHFKAVKFMREVRDNISNDIQNMSFEELKKYFEERRLKFNTKPTAV